MGASPHSINLLSLLLQFLLHIVLQEEGTESVLLVSHLPLVGSIVSELYGKRNPISFYPSTIVQIEWNGEKGTIEAFHYPK